MLDQSTGLSGSVCRDQQSQLPLLQAVLLRVGSSLLHCTVRGAGGNIIY